MKKKGEDKMTMKDDIQKVKTELEEIKQEKSPSLAMEILHDFKVQNKRLFVANIIEGIAILVLIIGLIIK